MQTGYLGQDTFQAGRQVSNVMLRASAALLELDTTLIFGIPTDLLDV